MVRMHLRCWPSHDRAAERIVTTEDAGPLDWPGADGDDSTQMTTRPGAEDRLYEQRLEKLNRLRAAGIDPYPARFERTDLAADVRRRVRDRAGQARPRGRAGRRRHPADGRLDVPAPAGRQRPDSGRASSGTSSAPEQYALLRRRRRWRLPGRGRRDDRTRTGEVTVEASELHMLSKALRPLPEKWHGLQDVETRYRKRYLDLIANPEVMEDLPHPQPDRPRGPRVPGRARLPGSRDAGPPDRPGRRLGASRSRPTTTPWTGRCRCGSRLELYLKRCIIGGIERVFEIGRNFRNEGISLKHNPEFTMLEVYQAYADYEDIMRLTEDLVSTVAQKALGHDDGHRQGRRRGRSDAALAAHAAARRDLRERPAWTTTSTRPPNRWRRRRPRPACASSPDWTRGKIIDELLSVFVEPKITSPVFLIDYPLELSPLAKQRTDRPDDRGALRGVLRRHGDRQRLQRAERPAGPARALPGAGPPEGRRRRRGAAVRRGLPGGARTRHAADRRHGHGHRPAGDDADRPGQDPRRDPVPADADCGVMRCAAVDADPIPPRDRP